jgi:hypothetical protein
MTGLGCTEPRPSGSGSPVCRTIRSLTVAARCWRGLAVVLFALGGVASAQQTATLSGVVTDSSGAVIPQAAVKLTNVETGESYTGQASDAGVYTIPLVKPGSYELTAQHTGFKQYRQVGIILETGIPARGDIRLEIGGVTETVSVEASVPLLRTESSSVGAIVRQETITNMPLIGRRAASLARLNGFMVQAGSDRAEPGARPTPTFKRLVPLTRDRADPLALSHPGEDRLWRHGRGLSREGRPTRA